MDEPARLESSGEFTIDSFKVASRYTALLEHDPSLPWLRLFQLAYRLGARSVAWTQRNHQTEFSCRGFGWTSDLESFFQAFPKAWSPTLQRLAEACWLGWAGRSATMTLQAAGAGHLHSLDLLPEGVVKRASQADSSPESRLVVHCPTGGGAWWQEPTVAWRRLRMPGNISARLIFYPLDGAVAEKSMEYELVRAVQNSPLAEGTGYLSGQGYPDREAHLVAADEIAEQDYFAVTPPCTLNPTHLYLNDDVVVIEHDTAGVGKVVSPDRTYRLIHPRLHLQGERVPLMQATAGNPQGILVHSGAETLELHNTAMFLLEPCRFAGRLLAPIRVKKFLLKERSGGATSRVIPIRDGLQLNPLRQPQWIPGRMVLAACPAHLKTDLSGLTLVDNQDLHQWLETLAP